MTCCTARVESISSKDSSGHAQKSVAFVPGRAFFADGSNGNTLRLSFSQADEATIEEGIRRLGQLLESYS